jgi:hypothetical protein
VGASATTKARLAVLGWFFSPLPYPACLVGSKRPEASRSIPALVSRQSSINGSSGGFLIVLFILILILILILIVSRQSSIGGSSGGSLARGERIRRG